MKIIWLGQAGLLFENENIKIMIDPYLSDSCGKVNPQSKRRVPVDEEMLKINPDIIICTHNHLDHLDPETLQHYLTEDSKVTVLCSENGFPEVRKFGGNNNYVMMHPGTEWTERGIKFSAVSAEHSELSALGIIIDDGEKKYYITGDTLYNKNIFDELPSDIYAVFLPINGKGNNMNMTDAARFAKKVGAKYSVPLHWGLFDSIDPTDFDAETAVIPKMYQEINL
ncbi:MAG: MBL fold metallo-hydrolase [Monoglobaceae bacterium]